MCPGVTINHLDNEAGIMFDARKLNGALCGHRHSTFRCSDLLNVVDAFTKREAVLSLGWTA